MVSALIDGAFEMLGRFGFRALDLGQRRAGEVRLCRLPQAELAAQGQHVVGVLAMAGLPSAGDGLAGTVGVTQACRRPRVLDVQVRSVRPVLEVAQAVFG